MKSEGNKDDQPPRKSSRQTVTTASSIALLVVLLGWGAWHWLSSPSEEVVKHLDVAIGDSSQLSGKVAKDFGNKIRSRKANVDDFVDEATGTFRALGSIFDSDAEKQNAMAELFADEVLSDKDLQEWAGLALAEHKAGLTQIQNELAANLDGVLADNLALSLQTRFQTTLDNDFHELAGGASDATLIREGSLVVLELIVIEQIITAVLARTGTSAAIAGTGAANAYWTFGLSIVAAIGIDFLWDWLDESDDRLAEETRRTLDLQALAAEEEMQKILLRIAAGTTEDWRDEIRTITFKTTIGLDP
jgi:hypothetical protein